MIKKEEKKDKNGNTAISYKYDFWHQGVRQRRTGFKTKKEAQQAADDLKIELSQNIITDKKLTFKGAVENFMNNYATVHCKSSTLRSYDSILKRHVVPYFEKKKVKEIKYSNINEYIAKKVSEGYSQKTINHHVELIRSVFGYLVNNDLIVKNPASQISKLRENKPKVDFLTPGEVRSLLMTANSYYSNMYEILATAIFTGARRNELLALTWDDIDFQNNKISINKNVDKKIITTTKSKTSNRLIDMSQKLKTILRPYKLRQPRNEPNLVFCKEDGSFLDPDTLTRRLKRVLKTAGIRDIRFHDLRHTYASILLSNEQVPVSYLKFISSQLGHSSINVTMDIYSHLLPSVAAQTVRIIDEIIEVPKNVNNL